VTHTFRRALVVFLVMAAWTSQAAAQTPSTVPSRSLVPAAFPRWDLSGGLGMLNVSTHDARSSWGSWNQKFEYRTGLGRYWTTHLRTDISVSTSNRWDDIEVAAFPVPGVAAPIYTYTNVEQRLTTVAPALTWQFRENTFMHPYVSAGVQAEILQQRRLRSPDIFRSTVASGPPIDERTTTILGRPFVAGGFKSYLSRSVFVRTEGRVALASTGPRQVSIVAGIGFDF
jgi:hypothetical protein